MTTESLNDAYRTQDRSQLGTSTLRATLTVLNVSKTLILTLTLLASLALNVASLTVAPVFSALSTAIESVAGNLTTVRGKHRQSVRALNTKLAAQSRRATTLAKSNASLKRTVKKTTRRISGRVAKATARSTGSIAAESIPYVGIGVILGVTAWEVSDACETMDDLHQLELAFDPEAGIDTEHTEVCGTQVPTKEEILQSLKESPGKAWDKANIWASDLPSWEDARGSAKDILRKLLELARSISGS